MYKPPSFTIRTIYPGSALEPSLYDVQILSTSSLAASLPVYGSLLDAWCLDKYAQIDIPGTYTANLYSSYEPGLLATSGSPIGANSLATNLDSVNWLLNHYDGANPGITWGEVQGAIWKLIGQDWRSEAWYLGPVDAADVDGLAAMALANDGFVPDAGQKIGIILDPIKNGVHAQPLILETRAAALGDRVWHDADADGRQDAGEVGIAGATVKLVRDLDGDGRFDGANEVIGTTVTSADGTYRFKGLTPGLAYQVVFETPVGYDRASARHAGAGSAAGTDSDGGVSDVVTLAAGENNVTFDAGFYRTASLGDRIWLDADADGRQGADEAGIAGMKVRLVGGGADGLVATMADNTTATIVTDAGGNYRFTGLTPGVEYEVQFSKPAGSVFTGRDAGGDDAADSDADAATGRGQIVRLVSGENNTTIDAGVFHTASLGDRVWLDTDADGRQDADEAGVAGLAVTLTGGGADGLVSTAADNTTTTVVTDADGNYRFTGLTPGVEYQVQFSKPAGSVFTGRDLGGDDAADSDADTATGRSRIVRLASGENDMTVDAGIYRTASLGDRVWLDADGNGRQNAGEAGIEGAAVTLIGGGADGIIDGTGDTAVTIVTDASGNYRFTGLTPGVQYQVQFSKPAGSVFTGRDAGGDDAADSDADSATGLSRIVVLASGEDNRTIDAGFFHTASLGDRVWLDADTDGRQDAGEAGMGGLAVTLIGGGADGLVSTTADNITSSVVTDAGGNYRFTGLTPGVEYQVRFSKPAGSVFSGRDLGGNDAADSDADTATGLSQAVVLASGEDNRTIDAGVYRAAIDIEKLVRAEYLAGGYGGTEGLTPGFWKNHADGGSVTTASAWGDTGFRPTESWETVFGRDVPGTPTLLLALDDGGGMLDALLRHATAALLNASNPNIDYRYSVAEVVSMTQAAIDSGSFERTKDLFMVQNEKEGSLTTAAAGRQTVVTADIDADTAGSGLPAPLGAKAVYTYLVKNAGDVALADVSVGDDRMGTPVYAGGDANGNGLLDAGETWRYSAGERIASAGDIVGVGTVTARAGSVAVADADATHVSVAPAVPVAGSQALPGAVLPAGSIGDRVWEDRNGDGVQNAGETGIAGVTVRLLGVGGAVLGTTVTDGTGAYRFGGLAAGDYKVQAVLPTGGGWVVARRDQGDDAADSDADATGATAAFRLAAGQDDSSRDIGLYRKAAVGDKVWHDLNHNGLQDLGEAGIAGVRVSLLDASGVTVLATTTTGSGGSYAFADLDPGSYMLQFDKSQVRSGALRLDDLAWGLKDKGTSDAVDSDVNGNGVSKTGVTRTDAFTLVSDQNDLTRDAALTPLVIDLDGGGIRTLARGDDGPAFDLLGDGSAVRSGWIAGGEGFLAVDSNGNGRIDGIGELFGGTARGAGFARLAACDSDGDGTVDASDAAFGELRIWQDANGNRVTDDGELRTLAEAGIASLAAGYVDLPFLDASGNLHLERSTATFADGRTTSMTDVYFNVSAEDAAAAGVALPTLADLLGDDRALDGLLGGTDVPRVADFAPAGALVDAAAAAGEMAELLRSLTAMARDENAHAAAGG